MFFGIEQGLPKGLDFHLFVICPNNSGSTFLKQALATSMTTWNLQREGQHTFGYAGPSTRALKASLIWGTRQSWIEAFQEPKNFDWEQTKRAWYSQASALSPRASVFVEKSPPFLLCVEQLRENFPSARFLFMLRDPYAVAEGILRKRLRLGRRSRHEILALAAQHLVFCFQTQAQNIKMYGDLGCFFRYEEMCENHELVQKRISRLIPPLTDLNLDQVLPVKGQYNSRLCNMNQVQLKRLSSDDFETLNKQFLPKLELLERFGYCIRRAAPMSASDKPTKGIRRHV